MPEESEQPKLIRAVGVSGATTLNMIDMIGVGPFITMPLIIAAMGGPQAMIGWIVGAILVICDGLVWAELGAAMPKSGGPYNYLQEIYGKNRLGRLMSFLFIWQLQFSAPLSMASGCLGFALYATYIFPDLGLTFFQQDFKLSIPLLESPPPVRSYAPESWGPNAIHQLIAPHAWRLPFERGWRSKV